MRHTLSTLFTLLLCPLVHGVQSDDEPAWAAPALERSISVRDGQTGAVLEFEEFLDRAAQAEVVFLGETHTDEATHRVELAVYEGLLERRGGNVVLAMEMFERDAQDDLNAYLRGEINEATFAERVDPWSNYRTAYRAMIEHARISGSPVIASNFPVALRRRLAMEGAAALDSLSDEEQAQMPEELFPNTPAYHRRVDNVTRSHRGMMGMGGDDQRLYSGQTLWDNSMGDACVKALAAHPDHSVLHVNGSFHSAYRDGTVHQLLLRRPDTDVITIAIAPTLNPASVRMVGTPSADYIVYTEARAKDLNQGRWSVQTPRELRYALHIPDELPTDRTLGLLIWLADDGPHRRRWPCVVAGTTRRRHHHRIHRTSISKRAAGFECGRTMVLG